MNAAGEAIRAEIRLSGPISFSRFMELALYSEPGGYYVQAGRVGKRGDFFTSVSVGSCFGELLARQFAECWELLEQPAPFVVIEQGANDGQLAADVLGALRKNHPACFKAAIYQIFEPLVSLRARQEETLKKFREKVSWHPAASSGAPGCGVFFCNELMDAFPVSLVIRNDARWLERRVAMNPDGSLAWSDAPITDARLRAETERILGCGDFCEGYVTEICLGIEAWLAATAQLLRTGYFFLIDYGMERSRYYESGRSEGTLRGYRLHRRADRPLEGIGETDLTAHVEWTRVGEAAKAGELEILGLADQSQFLTELAAPILKEMESSGPVTGEGRRWLGQFQTLTHPGHLGMVFQALALGKNLPRRNRLAGLRHDRPFPGV